MPPDGRIGFDLDVRLHEEPGVPGKSLAIHRLAAVVEPFVGEAPWQRACGSQPPAVTWCAPESDNPLNGGDEWDLGGSGPNVFEIGHGRDKRHPPGPQNTFVAFFLKSAGMGAPAIMVASM
jgi:hypothetical protein